jgi:hypothetical protein
MFGLRHNGAFSLKGISGRCCPSLSAVRGMASVGGPNALSRRVPATAWRGDLGEQMTTQVKSLCVGNGSHSDGLGGALCTRRCDDSGC